MEERRRQLMIQNLEAGELAREFQILGLASSNNNNSPTHRIPLDAYLHIAGPRLTANSESPHYFRGESSSGRAIYPSPYQSADVRNPYAFDANNSMGYNDGASYDMLQNHQPTASYYGGATGRIHHGNGGVEFKHNGFNNSVINNIGQVHSTVQKRKPSDVYSMILNLMIREDGSCKLEQLLGTSPYDIKVNLILAIARGGDILVKAVKDNNGIESVKVIIAIVKTSHDLCNCITTVLQENIFELMMHPNGIQLVQCCLKQLSYMQNSFLFDAAWKNCLKLAQNQDGRACLQECIEFSKNTDRQKILNKIANHCVMLAKHSKANYVLQFVLKRLSDHQFNQDICLLLKDHVEDLSMDQCGSYVIQTCIESLEGLHIIQQLARLNENKLEVLVTDRYGNYVLQTALKMSKGFEVHKELVRAINKLPKDLEDHLYASKVLRLVKSWKRKSKLC